MADYSLIWIAAWIILPMGCAPPANPPTARQEIVRADASADLPVVVLSGNPDSLGQQHGAQLGPQIRTLHEAYFAALFQDPRSGEMALQTAMRYAPLIPVDYLSEVRALAQSSGLAEDRAMLTQCFLDMLPMVACSTIALPAEASPDGIPRMGRNLDFMSMGVAHRTSVILVFKPEGKNAFVSIGWPGMIGVLTGMNEHGLTLANMEVTRFPRPIEAMPYVLLYRSILENCATVEQAIELLENAKLQTPNNLMLLDASGDRAVVEINPPKVVLRRAARGQALISTNHQRGADDHSNPGRCRRYDLLCEESSQKFGQIDQSALVEMISDVSVPGFTMQSMIFEPTRLRMYLSAGENAGEGPYHLVDLGKWMR